MLLSRFSIPAIVLAVGLLIALPFRVQRLESSGDVTGPTEDSDDYARIGDCEMTPDQGPTNSTGAIAYGRVGNTNPIPQSDTVGNDSPAVGALASHAQSSSLRRLHRQSNQERPIGTDAPPIPLQFDDLILPIDSARPVTKRRDQRGQDQRGRDQRHVNSATDSRFTNQRPNHNINSAAASTSGAFWDELPISHPTGTLASMDVSVPKQNRQIRQPSQNATDQVSFISQPKQVAESPGNREQSPFWEERSNTQVDMNLDNVREARAYRPDHSERNLSILDPIQLPAPSAKHRKRHWITQPDR